MGNSFSAHFCWCQMLLIQNPFYRKSLQTRVQLKPSKHLSIWASEHLSEWASLHVFGIQEYQITMFDFCDVYDWELNRYNCKLIILIKILFLRYWQQLVNSKVRHANQRRHCMLCFLHTFYQNLTNFECKNIIVYGGKGIVGGISAIMCAQHGSKCTIVGYDGINNVKKIKAWYIKLGTTITI